MSERKKHLSVNWVDGMKVSRTEFTSLENFLLDQIRDSSALALNDHNFGLLPSGEPGGESASLDVSSERVELHHCQAVTRAGARIDVPSGMDIPGLRQPTQQLTGGYDFSRSADWYVVVKTDPFVRLPYGKPAPDSHPLRHLNAMPLYELEIVPREQVQSARFFAWCVPVAKIKSGFSGGIEHVRNYIPPHASTSASLELVKLHGRCEDALLRMEQDAANVIRKLVNKKEKEKLNILADDTYLLAWSVLEFIAHHLDAYRLVVPQQPPVHFIEFFMRLARVVRNAGRLARSKSGMMEYFQARVAGFTTASFESAVEGLCSLVYNHFEIRESTDKVDNFVSSLRNLLLRLEEMDYEELAKYDPIKGVSVTGGREQQPVQQQPRQERRDSYDPGRTVIRPRGEPPRTSSGTEEDWYA